MQKYELLYFQKTGESNPLNSTREVAHALFADTGIHINPDDIVPGQTFTNGDEIIEVNAYGSDEEEEE